MLRLAASRGGARNALGHRPEPEVLPGSIKGGGPETRSGTVQSLKCCPCQQKQGARLPSAAPGSIKGGARNALGHRPEPEVLPLPAETRREAPKCCARNALGHRPEPEVLPLPAETSCEAPKCCAWQHQGGVPETRSDRPEPEVLPLPAEARGGGPETRSGTVQSLKCCPCQQKQGLAASRGGGPETRSGTVQSLKCCPCQQKQGARLPSAAPARAP